MAQTMTKLNNAETAAFCSQMAMILESGISATEGVSLMLEESGNGDEKKLLEQIDQVLLTTGSLHTAMNETGVFPSYALQMIRIGEFAGKLDDVMKSLAVHYNREDAISRSIRSAVTYPLIMILMMLAVILVLIIKVMPVFQQVFRQLGSEMTGFSLQILNLGQLLRRYSLVLILLVLVLCALMLYAAFTRQGRRQMGNLLAHLPGTGSYRKLLASCRFASGMALTLSAGISSDECIAYARDLSGDTDFQEKVKVLETAVSEGKDLAQALGASGIFTGVYLRMTVIALRAGRLEEAMQEISDRYQEDVDRKLSSLVSAIEPALVIFLSVVIGLLLLSVMIPLMGIMSGL